ncbi:MAG: MarR family transcriptional regulator [Flavobacteriaceae bacterium]|jgi:DNA-binding MarR family transcriptional regulator|nr:MarR family transcriptional regulator [Flavobacteriaceae bacterium]
MTREDKYSKLMISIRKIVRAVNLESKRIEKNFGLSIPQLLTLKFLKESPDFKSTMKDLKSHLSLNASTVTGIISRLELKGFIARLPSPNDKRSTPVVLTSKGHTLVNTTDESLHERMSKNSNLIQDTEFDKLLLSFETIIHLFDIDDIDASPIISGQTEI